MCYLRVKMHGNFLIVTLLLWYQAGVRSIRLVELRVPGHAAAGGEAILGCQFDTAGDRLYSVKWYKDSLEFYRYTPRNELPSIYVTPGVRVDPNRSSSDVITLVDLKRESTGIYSCEVTGEAPLFTTVSDSKQMTIHVLPQNGPRISGLHHAYRIGDRIIANCTSGPSSPEAQVKWLLNGKPIQGDHLQGPWYRVAEPPDTTETILELKLKARPVHFKRGLMEIKCQATIAPLYQQEVLYRISNIDDDFISLSKESEVTQTTTTENTQLYGNIDNSEEDRNFRKNALYEIRQRLFRGLDLHRTTRNSSSTIAPAIYKSQMPGSNDEEANIIYPRTELYWSINEHTTSLFDDESDAESSSITGNANTVLQSSKASMVFAAVFYNLLALS